MSLKISDLQALNSVTVGANGFIPKLLVEGSNSSGLVEIYVSAGSGNTLRLNTNFANGNYIDINPYITGVSNGGFSISQNGTPRLVITAGGNIGIGTTTDAGFKLDVNGNGRFSGRLTVAADAGNEQFLIQRASNTNAQLIIGYHSSGYGRIQAVEQNVGYKSLALNADGGNVGVGTVGPRTKLDVEAYTSFMSLSSGINSEATTDNQQLGGIDFRKHYALAISGSIRLLQSGGVNSYSPGHLAFYTNDGSTSFNTVPPEKMRLTSSGRLLINTQTDAGYRLDVNGTNRFQGYLNSNNCFERVFSQAISFPNGTANLAADVRFGNQSFWGYIEIEVTSTYSNQSSAGKLTKVFSVGTNPNNLIYVDESRVVDAIGTIVDNIAIGDFSWDGTNSTYRIPISHIVSSGNAYTVKVRMFTDEDGASRVFNVMTISSNYTLSALTRQYPYYNNRLGIGTSIPTDALDVRGNIRVSMSGVNDSGIIGFGNYLNGAGYYDNAIYRSALNSPNTPGNLLHISSYEALVFTTQAAQIGTQAVRMFINGANGNITIGGNSDNGYKLQVNGGFYGSYFKGGDSGAGSVIADFVNVFGTSAMYVRGDSRVGIGTTQPQKRLEVISDSNDVVSVGVNQIGTGVFTGIHFGYREANNSYRKSAIVFERTDLTSNNAQGKVHILNGPQSGAGNATLADAKLTIGESGNIGLSNTSPLTKLTLGGYVGNRLPYVNNTAYSFNAEGITVTSSTTSTSNKAGGLDLTNNTYSVGAYSPIISFSSLSSNGVYNNSYAGIWGELAGQGGDANWLKGDLVFGTAASYGIQTRMRIFSTGNVSIGGTDTGYRLDVLGTARFGTTVIGIDTVNSGNTKIQIASTAASNRLGFSGGANNITEENLYVWNFTTGASAGIFFQSSGTITASGGFFNSDIRLKEIVDYDYSVLDIKPISYLWKDKRDDKKHIGYSAQDVQKVMPDAVNEGEDGMLSVNYVEVLVAKIAELENRIKQLEK